MHPRKLVRRGHSESYRQAHPFFASAGFSLMSKALYEVDEGSDHKQKQSNGSPVSRVNCEIAELDHVELPSLSSSVASQINRPRAICLELPRGAHRIGSNNNLTSPCHPLFISWDNFGRCNAQNSKYLYLRILRTVRRYAHCYIMYVCTVMSQVRSRIG